MWQGGSVNKQGIVVSPLSSGGQPSQMKLLRPVEFFAKAAQRVAAGLNLTCGRTLLLHRTIRGEHITASLSLQLVNNVRLKDWCAY